MKQRFLAWWGDVRSGDLNPVMVRELRQYIRSRFANWVVVLMLIGLLLIALGFLGSSQSTVTLDGTRLSEGNGGGMYAAVAFVLGVASVLVALYTSQRLGKERDKQKPDLLFTTSLKPGAIVRGKLYAGLAMFGLLFSLAMPFMTTTYLLRGIDVPTILWGLLWLFVGNVVLLSVAVLLGCMPLGPLFRRGSIGMGLFALYAVSTGIGMSPRLIRGGTFFRFGGPMPKEFVIGVAAVVVTAVLFTYATSVLILSPRYSNRFLPYRLTLTFLWMLGLGLIAWYALHYGLGRYGVLSLWLVPSSLLLLFMVQVSECTPDLTSRRVLGRVPRSFIGRLVCFPFYSGGANGFVWSLGLLAIGYGALQLLQMAGGGRWRGEAFLVTILYAVCYILTAGLISRRLPEEARQGAGAPWLLSMYFFATAAMVPLFLDLLSENRKIHYDPDAEYGNVFAMFRGQWRAAETHLAVGIPWLFLLLILNTPRLIRAFDRFKRPAEAVALKDVMGDDGKVEAFEA